MDSRKMGERPPGLDYREPEWATEARTSTARIVGSTRYAVRPAAFRVTTLLDGEAELALILEPQAAESRMESSSRSFGADVPEETTTILDTVVSPPAQLRFPGFYRPGHSPPMRALYAQMARLLDGDLPVLVHGETGAGKELVARVLHDSSERSQHPFIAVNCAAIPADLLEAEMFGIAKGVATGVDARTGKFHQAEGGTLFLDEIAEMAPALQAKLLRALQEKEIHPVGGRALKIDLSQWRRRDHRKGAVVFAGEPRIGRRDDGQWARDRRTIGRNRPRFRVARGGEGNGAFRA